MEHNNRLDDWLAAARVDVAGRTPDLLTEQRLLARVREVMALRSIAATNAEPQIRRARRIRLPRPGFSWLTPAFAVAVSLVIAVGILMIGTSAPDDSATERTPFFALVASEAIAAERSALVVSSQVSGAALADYGLPIDPARVDQPVSAEFLMSPAGIVLAVRFTE